MTKAELISIIAKVTGITKSKAAKALSAYENTVTKELKKSGKMKLVGFGTFSVVNRKARKGRNPQTGEQMVLDGRRVITWKYSPVLKKVVNRTGTGLKK